MSRELYDWDKDDELKRNTKVVYMPKPKDNFEALLNGFKSTKNGMLEKEIELTIRRPEEIEVPVQIDEKGREYFINEYGYREYFDEFGRYQVRLTEDRVEEEFIVSPKTGKILVFLDPEHMHVKTEDGRVLEYDPVEDKFYDIGHILNYYNPKR